MSNSYRLKNKVVLITGGTSGIGKATAIKFADEGANVFFTGRRKDLGDDVSSIIKSFGGFARYIEADHTAPELCKKCVEIVIERFGRIDVLHNNAGIMVSGTAEESTEEEWLETFNINVFSMWRMSKLVLPYMRKQGGGVIINTASDWGVVGGKKAVAYSSSKGAVIQMTKSMALDHAHENIRVNAVCPADVMIERWKFDGLWRGDGPPDNLEQLILDAGQELPIGRVAKPEEIANVVLFLASDDSSFITGTSIFVDGGSTAA